MVTTIKGECKAGRRVSAMEAGVFILKASRGCSKTDPDIQETCVQGWPHGLKRDLKRF